MGANVVSKASYHTELIDGQEIEKPLPKYLHAVIQTYIVGWFITHFPAAGALSELNVICGADRIVPDITVPPQNAQFIDGDLVSPPDLAIEILSPGQLLNDVTSKCDRLLQAGTGICWIIWPERRRAWNFSLDDIEELNNTNRFLRFGNPERFGALQLQSSLSVEDLWAELDRRGL